MPKGTILNYFTNIIIIALIIKQNNLWRFTRWLLSASLCSICCRSFTCRPFFPACRTFISLSLCWRLFWFCFLLFDKSFLCVYINKHLDVILIIINWFHLIIIHYNILNLNNSVRLEFLKINLNNSSNFSFFIVANLFMGWILYPS